MNEPDNDTPATKENLDTVDDIVNKAFDDDITLAKKERDLIRAIADRSQTLFARAGHRRSLLDCMMDIEIAHKAMPLDLQGLLSADDMNFSHDVGGIAKNLNHITEQIDNFFVPRFTANA